MYGGRQLVHGLDKNRLYLAQNSQRARERLAIRRYEGGFARGINFRQQQHIDG